MNITHVQVVSVPVADQDRAKSFYADTLGFTVIADQPMGDEGRWVQVGPKGSKTSLTLVTWFPTMPAGSLNGLVLETTDIDGDAAALAGAGVEVDGPHDEFWGRHATFRDPDGNGIVLRQAR
ncbi:VOC family protein [Hamadaea tsunoensis]|uniref:VOC family protein n=1 Tax=Hamadaea tsunoensis TaxID=53368 RepID=UPI00048674AD|nr:VOC family protein [Hamadaea tsunoensis]